MVSPHVAAQQSHGLGEIRAPRDAGGLLELHPNLHGALRVLSEAAEYATELERSRWDFAVEIADLRQAGLSRNDFRWLVCAGFVEHAIEVTDHQSMERVFAPEAGLVFSAESCFVLTDLGLQAVSLAQSKTEPQVVSGYISSNRSPGLVGANVELIRPVFRNDVRELSLGIHLVKRFRLPSPNQETILLAFEEEKWAARIDDPLPPSPTQDSPHRLRETIKSLNRHQVNRLIHFSAAGDGQGILWSAQNVSR